jgi:hypothetical protein
MMSNEISLETRASSAYIRGRLEAMIEEHILCECSGWTGELRPLLKEWAAAEAELQAIQAKPNSISGNTVIEKEV